MDALADRLQKFQVLAAVCVITQGAKPFQVGKGKPPQTRQIVDEKPYVSASPADETFRPLPRRRLIQRYQTGWNQDYWISFGDWLAEPRYSAQYDAAEKIVVRQTGDTLVATLEREQFVVRDNLHTILPRTTVVDPRFILRLLNSRLLNWFYRNVINPEQGEALAQVKRGHLAQLPIATLSDSAGPDSGDHQNQLIALVEHMLDLESRLLVTETSHERTNLQHQVDATDRRIDRLVYTIYGLTEDEITIVKT